MEYWEVEIHYKDKTTNSDYHIEDAIDSIVVTYDDNLMIEDGLYLNTLNYGELTIDLSNIDIIYVNHIENGFCDDYYVFREGVIINENT